MASPAAWGSRTATVATPTAATPRAALNCRCCARAAPGDPPYALATAPGVAGFLLTSLEDANARCAASLGAGWRLASFHDGGGWELHGQVLLGTLADRRYRAWVFIGDQPGNCWDKP